MLEHEQLYAACKNSDSNYYSIALTPTGARALPLDVRAGREEDRFPRYDDIYKRLLMGTFLAIYENKTNEHPYDILLREGKNPNRAAVITIDQAAIERHIATVIDNLFPTQQVTPGKSLSIQLSTYDIDTIKKDPQRLKMMIFHLAMMMRFYGFSLGIQDEQKNLIQHKVTITFDTQTVFWIRENSPYYQHITTILQSLKLLGLDNYAKAFAAGLQTASQVAFSNNMPAEQWQEIAAVPAQAQPMPAAAAIPIPEANIQHAWKTTIDSLRDYYVAKLMTDEGLDFFFTARRTTKRQAILNLLRVLTRNPVMTIEGVPAINTESLRLSTAEKKQVLETAGAMARGYIVGFPDTTASWLRQSRLHIHLEQLVEIQQQCVAGILPAPGARAAPVN